jgi:N4-gp56 family major capsid protein
MTQYTWAFDAPTGTYKSHAMSGKLFEAALEDSVFMDHVQPVNGYGRRMGESVTLTRLSNVTEPTSGDLTEGERIPEDTLSLSTTSITVTEIGRSIPYTSLSDDLSKFDITSPVQKGLRNQMKLTLDTKAATAFKTAQVKYIPTGLSSGTFDTDGTASTSATANMNVYHIEEIVDYMYDTLQVPQIGDDYVGIFRRLALRGIRRDPAWEEWHKYTDPQAKYNGETGRMEGMRMIETNHANALAKVGTNSVLGEGVVFGEDGIALAEVQTPELRAAMPTDFGRSKAVAWYGILEFGIIWDTANAGEARIVHVTSS